MKSRFTLSLLLCLTSLSCQRSAPEPTATAAEEESELPEKLSALELFIGPLAEHRPAAHVFSYDLRTPLFSDYTLKYRFIKLPCKAAMLYRGDDETIDFPVGTIISKTFAYPYDQRNPEAGRKLLEAMLARADVLVTNQPLALRRALGLDSASLARRFANLSKSATARRRNPVGAPALAVAQRNGGAVPTTSATR